MAGIDAVHLDVEIFLANMGAVPTTAGALSTLTDMAKQKSGAYVPMYDYPRTLPCGFIALRVGRMLNPQFVRNVQLG